MNKVDILLVAEPGFEPTQAHPGDAGLDLRSTESIDLAPGERATVGTGISIALPNGYVGLVHPRSGLAAKSGITIVNAPGTIDAGYRGEIRVTLLNTSRVSFRVERSDRIAQLLIQAFETPNFIKVDSLPGSDRGEAGFGSSGVK